MPPVHETEGKKYLPVHAPGTIQTCILSYPAGLRAPRTHRVGSLLPCSCRPYTTQQALGPPFTWGTLSVFLFIGASRPAAQAAQPRVRDRYTKATARAYRFEFKGIQLYSFCRG